MDTLVGLNSFKLDHHLTSMHPQQNHVNSCRMSRHDYNRDSIVFSNGLSPVAQSTSEGDESEETDHSDAILKYISQMLMEEEDLEHKPYMFYDSMALPATEKYFYDALNYEPKINLSPFMDGTLKGADDDFSRTCITQSGDSSSDVSSWISNPGDLEYSPVQLAHFTDASKFKLQFNQQSFSCSNGFAGDVSGRANLLGNPHQVQDLSSTGQYDFKHRGRKQIGHLASNDNVLVYDLETAENTLQILAGAEERVEDNSPNGSTGKRHYREDTESVEDVRSNKLLAISANESDSLEMYDNVLLYSNPDPREGDELMLCSSPKALQQNEQPKGSKRRRPYYAGKKQGVLREVVDLRSLLMQCAQAVASYDNRTADELLNRIRQHSSPSGDATERLAYYFTNALEARLAGTGTTLYTSFDLQKYSAADVLKAYKVYVTACPFRSLSNIFANKCIKKVASNATRLHIIDFGVLYGLQWPCLIQILSEMPGGPPKLRITGIDFPQPGFPPAEKVEDTGRRLAKYCKRFNVPFEYNAIAKKWDTIQLEDFQIDNGEVLAVNCLYRLKNVPDETVVSSSPRDAVLNLIKRIKPDIFVHGVTSGTYNSPFFVTRFREALFHFSSLFDMFDANLQRDNQERMLYEKEVYGRDAMNVMACEGTQRVERPETYKQWQVRNLRAGFRQLPLDREIVNSVRDKVKKCYHKDFIVVEDGNWMLQGWKGKVIYALSCWKPSKKHQ